MADKVRVFVREGFVTANGQTTEQHLNWSRDGSTFTTGNATAYLDVFSKDEYEAIAPDPHQLVQKPGYMAVNALLSVERLNEFVVAAGFAPSKVQIRFQQVKEPSQLDGSYEERRSQEVAGGNTVPVNVIQMFFWRDRAGRAVCLAQDADVVLHEASHAVIHALNASAGQAHPVDESAADALANIISDNPLYGEDSAALDGYTRNRPAKVACRREDGIPAPVADERALELNNPHLGYYSRVFWHVYDLLKNARPDTAKVDAVGVVLGVVQKVDFDNIDPAAFMPILRSVLLERLGPDLAENVIRQLQQRAKPGDDKAYASPPIAGPALPLPVAGAMRGPGSRSK